MQPRNPQKKKSLFSQKIKQARQKNPPNQDPFPKAININITNTQITHTATQPIIQQQAQSIQTKQNDQTSNDNQNYIQRMMSNVLKQQDIKQIQKQNMKAVMQMSQQQVRKYQEMIMRELPASFLAKIKKNGNNTNKITNKVEEVKPSSKDEYMVDQKQQANYHKQNDTKTTKQNEQNKQDKMSDKQAPGTLSNLLNLYININTQQVIYIPSQLSYLNTSPQQIISTTSLKQMIQSQNNQTQIIGCKLLTKLCDKIFNQLHITNLPQYIPIVNISGLYFHLVLLAHDVYELLLRSVIFQISKTKFKTCWVEELETVVYCVQLMGKCLRVGEDGEKYVKDIVEFMQTQLQRKDKFFAESNRGQQTVFCNNFICKINKFIQLLSQPLIQQQIACQKYPLISCQYSSQILNLIKLQQLSNKIDSHLPFNSLLYNIAAQSFKYYGQHLQQLQHFFIQFTYPIALQLLRRDIKTNGLNKQIQMLKTVVYEWLCAGFGQVPAVTACMTKNIDNIAKQQYVFKCLHITKILSLPSYIKTLQQYPKLSSLSPIHTNNQTASNSNNNILANILTFLNLQQYFKNKNNITTSQQKQQQITFVEEMIKFVINKLACKQNNYFTNILEFVLVDLIGIFCLDLSVNRNNSDDDKQKKHLFRMDKNISQQQYKISYQDIQQQTLDLLFRTLCQSINSHKHLPHLWTLLTQQKIKSLISSYNYDSFGDYTFTKLFTFLLATCPDKNMQIVIVEEVVSRYPFLFYYAAANGLYGGQQIYLNGNTFGELQSIYDIINVSKKIDGNNLFVRYLLRK